MTSLIDKEIIEDGGELPRFGLSGDTFSATKPMQSRQTMTGILPSAIYSARHQDPARAARTHDTSVARSATSI